MNRQHNSKTGARGIEWTDLTMNPVAGCEYGCRWEMPDGTVAKCYAESVAEGVARSAYPDGFAHHYFRSNVLNKKLPAEPSLIFLDSMSDLFGPWVPDDQVDLVLDWVGENRSHVFQVLTKSPGRLRKFATGFPDNLWVGISSPPDFLKGERLTRKAQERFLIRSLDVLDYVGTQTGNVVWMSFEPLSWDVSGIVESAGPILDWSVIGAASNGRSYYQPDPGHVQALIDVLDDQGVAIFYKGNLKWEPRREDFPISWVDKWSEAVLKRESNALTYDWPINQKLLKGMTA